MSTVRQKKMNFAHKKKLTNLKKIENKQVTHSYELL
jgi:hypothetical protein